MNFAGGGAYTYFKYTDSQHQPSTGITYIKDHVSTDHNSQYSKSPINGHYVQQSIDSSTGTTENIIWSLMLTISCSQNVFFHAQLPIHVNSVRLPLSG